MLKADDSAPDQAELDMMMQLRQRQQALGGELATSSGMLDADDPDTAALYRSLQARRSQLGSLDEDETATDPSLAAQQAAEAFLPSTPLTGHVLQTMVMAKYGLQYDLSIVKRDIPGRTLVRLNVMWQHPKQVSFALSEREFDEKMDTIAYYLRCVYFLSLLFVKEGVSGGIGGGGIVGWCSFDMHPPVQCSNCAGQGTQGRLCVLCFDVHPCAPCSIHAHSAHIPILVVLSQHNTVCTLSIHTPRT